MQWPKLVAGTDRLVGGLCRQPRVIAIDVDKGLQPRIKRGDAGQLRLHHIHR